MATSLRTYYLVIILLILMLSSCQASTEIISNAENFRESSTPFFPELSTSVPGSEIIEVNTSKPYWIDPSLPENVRAEMVIPDEILFSDEKDLSNIHIEIGQGDIVGEWVYALVAPFPTIIDRVSFSELAQVWEGKSVESFGDEPLLLSAETLAVFSKFWGAPARGAVESMAAKELLDEAWARESAWAIVPFEALSPRWKVLAVDGQSPIWKDFDAEDYALTIPIGISGDGELALFSNRYEEKMTTLVTTGVTALVRATAWDLERKGLTYAAEVIGPLLREADILHISNEVPFAEDCPPPNPGQRSLIFCSDARYIELLEDIGTDIVELTGDHFNDWTREAMLFTLELYQERGWPYYGGGANLDEGLQALELEHNGNKIAFIGCNGKGGGYASADVDYPGAVECDYEWLDEEIARLSGAGTIVIATFQHDEVYTYVPQPGLMRDFQRAAKAGASIVSGSQAHQAHGMQFYDEDSFIMYGLGNLFFDQIVISQDTSQALIGRHVIYDGRYISSEIFTTVFIDYAKSISFNFSLGRNLAIHRGVLKWLYHSRQCSSHCRCRRVNGASHCFFHSSHGRPN